MSKRRRGQAGDAEGEGEQGADPEFLALTERQRSRIDTAFDRGVDRLAGRKRKRPNRAAETGPSKIPKPSTEDVQNIGGFVNEGDGGFVDEGDGGFVNDGDGDFVDDGDGGGFLPDEADGPFQPNPPPSAPSTPPPTDARLPLRHIPHLLQSLGLPFDDDVLNVFKASATGWDDDEPRSASRRGAPAEDEGGVERKDFRAVCAALMAGDEDDGGDVAMGDAGADRDEVDDGLGEGVDHGGGFLGGEASDDEDDDEDAYFDSQSSMSSLSSDSEYGASRPRRAARDAKGKGKARTGDTESEGSTRKTRRKTKRDVLRETGPIKLSGKQREVVQDIWDMLRPPSGAGGKGGGGGRRGGNILGRDEVKAWARSLGEMWTDDEITEMVALFSSQHEQRGLSFEDFGAIMVRAGLA